MTTGREGVASKVGHDLTITFDRWSAHSGWWTAAAARCR
jgi:hypothetical protein